jgi:hypothetical protein
MSTQTRTIYGAALDTALRLKLDLPIFPHTTINEALNINSSASVVNIPSNNLPYVNVVCIGNGGVRTTIRPTDQTASMQCASHSPEDAGLYNQIPFIMRLKTNDLTTSQRSMYRLRKTINVNGIDYYAYYGMVLDKSASVVTTQRRTRVNNIVNTSAFTPDASDLSPTPIYLTTGQVVVASGDLLTATALVPFRLGIVGSLNQVEEYLNVYSILYGQSDTAVISEIAFCSSIDTLVSGDLNGATIQYTDSQHVQINNFVSGIRIFDSPTQTMDKTYAMGAAEPLMSIQ